MKVLFRSHYLGECFEWIDSNPKHSDAIIEKNVFTGLFEVLGVS